MRWILPYAAWGLMFGMGGSLQAQGPAECAALANLQIPNLTMVITRTEWTPTSPPAAPPAAPRYTGPLPAFCRLDAILDKRTGEGGKPYGIGFALTMPAGWNHRFLMQGGGGLNGSVQFPLGAQAAGAAPALARGFAVVNTDSGHTGTGAFDASFLQDQQASLDFAYIAVGRVAQVAKLIIARYYGQAPEHSYFSGCSTGGREAMLMTQRFPLYFDGVVAGAPAMRTGFSNLADRWVAISFNQIAPKDEQGKPVPGGAFTDAERQLVVKSLLTQCDLKDGIEDGMIFNISGCGFDPASLVCSGAKDDTCLTAQQAGALKRAFGGPKDSRGVQVYPGFLFDTGITAKRGIPGLLNPGPSPVGPPNLGTQQDVDKEAMLVANPLVDTTATNLTTFAGHGGKLLFYHGVSDPWFSALDTLEYYRKMAAANGGLPKVANWSRLYMVPGMGHCGGGDAALDTFDMLTAVVDWVEKGVAPDSVLATGKAFPGRSRPLCSYPKSAHYTGQGDPQDAQNFVCRE